MSYLSPCVEYINGSDYSSVAIPVTFEPCEMRKCITVAITDDLRVEEVEELFIVTLERGPMTNSLITVESVPAVVTITDDDGM